MPIAAQKYEQRIEKNGRLSRLNVKNYSNRKSKWKCVKRCLEILKENLFYTDIKFKKGVVF